MTSLAIKNNRGFTLLEVMLYLVLFSLVVGGIIALSHSVLSQRVKNQVIAEVNYQAEAVNAAIIRAVHEASSVSAPTPGNGAGSLTLAMPSSQINPTVFQAVFDSSTTRLQISEGSPAVKNFLTNSHVTIGNLNFTNAAVSGGKDSIKFQFDLSYKSSSQRSEYQFTKSFFGAADIK